VVLTDDLLARCAERAAGYDRENRFFQEDFDELKAAGYLTMAVPEELGGKGMKLDAVCQEQRRLGYHAAPTALAVNMHLYWTGVAADLWRAGDRSLEWILTEAANGAVFAAGHAESGNDMPVLLSTSRARRVDGGYEFTSHKSFGSLTPVWNYMGLHALDDGDPAAPRIVHAFLPRDAKGVEIRSTWDDVLGMRATRSDDTILDGAFIPERYVARVLPPGFAGADAFVLGIFAWALMGFGNVYYGLARRIFDVTVGSLGRKRSIAIASRSMARHPGIQSDVAEMWIELERIGPHLDAVADDWSRGVDHAHAWVPKIFAAKYSAVEGAWRVADKALDVAGGFGIFPASGIERLLRDARIGRLHPANAYLTREVVAKIVLGLDPAEPPRWG
jgi:alkylation response protein AidB-like acyl-CoA dehydrogenase